MPIITSSILMALKGAIFIAKSSAAKAILVKYGPYLLSKGGLVFTAKTGFTVAAVTGCALTIKSIPERSIKGFTQIINGIRTGSAVDFMDGLYQLGMSYSTANSLLSDFNEFIEASEFEPEVKISLKDTMKGMTSLLENEIEQKSYALLKEIEDYIKSKGLSPTDYSERVKAIYIKNTFDLSDDYRELLVRGEKIYSDITSLNLSFTIGHAGEFDNYLAYCIAGWMKDNLQLSCITDKTQKALAGDITDQTIRTDFEERIKSRGISPTDYYEDIKSIYIKHTSDLNDDFNELLGRGGRIYSDISALNHSLSIADSNEYDYYLAYCIAGWMKDNLQLSCITDKTQNELAGDITDQIFAYLRAYGLG